MQREIVNRGSATKETTSLLRAIAVRSMKNIQKKSIVNARFFIHGILIAQLIYGFFPEEGQAMGSKMWKVVPLLFVLLTLSCPPWS